MDQLSLFSLEPKIKRAVENLKLFEAAALQMHPEGYYLAFSGGKDSQVIYHLAKMAGVRFQAYYHITTVDPPELVRFIRTKYPEVVQARPELSMWSLILKKKFPPTRRVRYCCSELKEHGGKGRFVITGVRWEESKKRKERGLAELAGPKKPAVVLLNNDNDEKRRLIENCSIKGKRVLNPIIDWTESEVWQFIHKYVQMYCGLYDDGFSRIGCIGCPLISAKRRLWELERYPKYKQAYLHAFQRMLEERNAVDAAGKCYTAWQTAEDVYHWWLFGEEKKEEEIQGQLQLELETGKGEEMFQNNRMKAEKKENAPKIERLRQLSHEWDKVWKYGSADKMWTDGITLNQLRKEMLEVINGEQDIGKNIILPDTVPNDYMANADKIRRQAGYAKEKYLQAKEYQYLCQMEKKLTDQQKAKTNLMLILGKVRNLIRAVDEDDLVIMREYGEEGLFSRQILETAAMVKMLVQTELEEKNKEDDNEQLEGQMTIYDFVA